MFPGALIFPGKEVAKKSFEGFVHRVGFTPLSHLVKLFEVPDLSARKITLIFWLGSV